MNNIQSHSWNEWRLFAVLESSALSIKWPSLGKRCWKCWQVALRNDTGVFGWSWHRYSWLAFGCEPLPRCTAVPAEHDWLSQQVTVLWMYISRTNTCLRGITWEIHFSSPELCKCLEENVISLPLCIKSYMQVCVAVDFSYPLKACGGFLVNYCAGLQERKKRKACIILTGLTCESL